MGYIIHIKKLPISRIIGVFSGIFITIGVITLIITEIINKVMPILGRIAFQARGGTYSPKYYYIDFGFTKMVAVVLIIIGAIAGYKMFKKEIKLGEKNIDL